MNAGPRAFRAVLLDLDGTLLDTAPDIASAANRMLLQLGRATLPEAQVVEFIGKGVANLVHRVLAETGGDGGAHDHALEIFENTYLAHVADRSRPYPGVIAGLDRFRARGMALACVTNKASRFTLPLLAATGLSPYFGAVVSGDDVARRKPEPDAFLAAAGALGVTPAESWVIGDSANDVKAARAAGMAVVVVPYGYREGLAVEALGADAVVASLEAAAGSITMVASYP
ncbi:phosphoglycolate phosphatase [Betaproteobacteria bacterium GR16-43]|nr:phosphoglycolate phosphatase [Betaproteobacteria bacterium GR16-43]